MRITGIDLVPLKLRLEHPYRIAYQVVSESRLLFLRIRTAEGIDGCGCAAPEEEITGESFEAARDFLDSEARDILTGSDPLRRVLLMKRLYTLSPATPSARAAVETALIDLLGRKVDLPVWRIFGGYRRGIETSITIGISSLETTLAEARDLIARGFGILKLKGGLSPEEDAEKLNRIREIIGPQRRLRFDANQGYSVAEARRLLQLAAPAQIEILEQPTPRGEPHLLGHLTGSESTPVMADESLQTLFEAFHLARNELVDMVNIKLMKVGGFGAATRIDAVARAAGIESMVGCMDEPAIGIAASLHFCLAHENVEYADLDGYLDLKDDPSAGSVRLRRGILYPSDSPGFGPIPPLF